MTKALPKIVPLPGSVIEQRVKCGKANCRCACGELHMAFYRFWREDGRLRKVYVRRGDLEAIRAACARWRECEDAMKAILSSADADRVRAQTRAMLRDAGLEPPRKMYRRGKSKGKEPDVEKWIGEFVKFETTFFKF